MHHYGFSFGRNMFVVWMERANSEHNITEMSRAELSWAKQINAKGEISEWNKLNLSISSSISSLYWNTNVQPLTDVFSSNRRSSKKNELYENDCTYEIWVHVFVFADSMLLDILNLAKTHFVCTFWLHMPLRWDAHTLNVYVITLNSMLFAWI